MKGKIYTKKGDSGTTSLIGGTIVSKTNIRVESYGMVDELNSFTGCLYEKISNNEIRLFIKGIMDKLFLIESHLAVDKSNDSTKFFRALSAEDTKMIELEIDRLSGSLPPLNNFILPAGCDSASCAHVCRTVCRRTERTILRLNEEEKVDAEILKFINRLSDYFFTLARYLSQSEGKSDVVWDNK